MTWREEWSAAHAATATRCWRRSAAERARSPASSGTRALDELITAHELWSDWLGSGRVRKFALVAEKR